MRKVAVIGAGQGGLHLGLGLLDQGNEVTMLTDKTPEQMLAINALAGHTLQARSLDYERRVGACLADEMPHTPTRGLDFAISLDGENVALGFAAPWERDAFAMDLRLKYALLMRRFEERGGKLVHHAATPADLEDLAEAHDNVFLATGKGDLRNLFAIDEARTVHSEPQRRLAIVLLSDVAPRRAEQRELVNFLIRPGLGELFFSPILHMSERTAFTCLVAAIPGGPMDVFGDLESPEDGLAAVKRIFAEHLRWEADTVAGAEVADPKGMLRGAVTPQVRRPIARLPNGAAIAAIGDVTMVHDPVAGLGANTTAAQVDALLSGIAALDGAPIEPEWIEAEFERFWESDGQWFSRLANLVLEPLTEPVQAIFAAAVESPAVARAIANTWSYPAGFWPAFDSMEGARRFVAEAKAAEAETEARVEVG